MSSSPLPSVSVVDHQFRMMAGAAITLPRTCSALLGNNCRRYQPKLLSTVVAIFGFVALLRAMVVSGTSSSIVQTLIYAGDQKRPWFGTQDW